MTAPRPGDAPRPFAVDELADVPGIDSEELAAALRLARELEGVAARGAARPSAGFAERVMASIEAEPVPAPVVAAGSALRRGAALGLIASIRDAFRVAFGGGFPIAARAQALALVLLVTGVAAASGGLAAGALGVFDERSSPSPAVETPVPTPSLGSGPSPSPVESPAEPSGEPAPSVPGETPEADAESPEAETPESAETDAPVTAAPRATSTPDDGESATAKPTPRPTPRPTTAPTAAPTDEPEASHPPQATDEPEDAPTPSPSAPPDPSSSPDD